MRVTRLLLIFAFLLAVFLYPRSKAEEEEDELIDLDLEEEQTEPAIDTEDAKNQDENAKITDTGTDESDGKHEAKHTTEHTGGSVDDEATAAGESEADSSEENKVVPVESEPTAASEDVHQVESTSDDKDKADTNVNDDTATETGGDEEAKTNVNDDTATETAGVEEAVDANDENTKNMQDDSAIPSDVNDDATPADIPQETQEEASAAEPLPDGNDESSQKQAATQTQASATAQAEPISLQVEGVGRLTVAPDQEPADLVEEFAQQALDAGVGISNDMMVQMLTKICNRRACTRLELRPPTPKAKPLTLEVEGVGTLTVGPTQEPADLVEEFAQQALDAGVGISNDMMVQMLTNLCNRRACTRLELRPPTPKAKPLTLEVEGVGTLTVGPTQEPADMVEMFAQQALDAGVGISNDMMVQMLTQLCNRRACTRLGLRPPTPKAA